MCYRPPPNLFRCPWLTTPFLSFCALTAALGLGTSALARTQNQEEKVAPVRFVISSIRPVPQGPHRVSLRLTPDGLMSEGAPLYMVLWQALGVPNDRIFGAPDWTRTACYDIEARVDSDEVSRWQSLSQKDQWQVVLLLLEDRFGLKLHHESRAMRAYNLVVAKGGPRMNDSAQAEAGALPKPVTPRFSRTEKGLELKVNGASSADLTNALANALGSTVTDATGLTGKYNFTLDYSEERDGAATMAPDSESHSADSWPSIFTALQEQLGLKLEPKKEPVDVIVLDQIQKPTSN